MAADAAKRAYLLGLLASEEATRLEEGFFAEESVFEELVLAEDDLIDEYVDGRLADDERNVFEDRLRERPELRARVDARRPLCEALRRRRDGAVVTVEGRAARLGGGRVFLGLAAAAAAVFVMVRAAQERPGAAPGRPATDARLETPRTSAPPVVLVLGSGGVRDAGAVPTAKLSAQVPSLRLRLPTGRAGALEIVSEDVDGAGVWKGAGRFTTADAGSYAEAEVPAAALPAGDYIARFSGLPAGAEESFFRVQR